MNPALIKAVYTEREHTRHTLTAMKEAGWNYLPVSDEMHRNEESGKDDLEWV